MWFITLDVVLQNIFAKSSCVSKSFHSILCERFYKMYYSDYKAFLTSKLSLYIKQMIIFIHIDFQMKIGRLGPILLKSPGLFQKLRNSLLNFVEYVLSYSVFLGNVSELQQLFFQFCNFSCFYPILSYILAVWHKVLTFDSRQMLLRFHN